MYVPGLLAEHADWRIWERQNMHLQFREWPSHGRDIGPWKMDQLSGCVGEWNGKPYPLLGWGGGINPHILLYNKYRMLSVEHVIELRMPLNEIFHLNSNVSHDWSAGHVMRSYSRPMLIVTIHTKSKNKLRKMDKNYGMWTLCSLAA